MGKLMRIYVPTRAREDKQITARALLMAGVPFTLVVDWIERESWLRKVEELRGSRGKVDLLVCGKNTPRHIGAVRQFIVDQHSADNEYGPGVLMLDDDLRFFKRRTDDPTKFLSASSKEIVGCLGQLTMLMRDYAHGGLCAREGANRSTKRIEECTRLLRALWYDVTVLRKQKIRFDRMTVMEDFDVALQLLRAGYKSFCYRDFVQDQTQSNAPGGCSIYRTLDVQAAGAKALNKLHPEFTKVVQKTTTTAWQGATRYDINVMWKKAYLSSGKEL